MPRVLHIINRLNLGGPTFNVAYLAKYLAPQYESMLVAGMIDDSEASSQFILDDMGLQPVYIPEMYRRIAPVNDLRAYHRLKQIISEFKPDIVHTNAAKAGALGRMAAHACHVPVVLHTFHGHVFHSYFSRWKSNLFVQIERRLANISTRIIAISDQQKRELCDEFAICAAEKVEVIPLGLELDRFTQNMEEKRRQFRAHYLLADDEVAIAIVGRLVPIKNHTLFLQAFRKVKETAGDKVRAFIVGDGEARKSLESLALQLDLDFTDFNSAPRRASLTFTSWIKEVDVVYAGCDVVALTSLNEGTPVSLIEALAARKPIVTTNAGAISDFVEDGRNGFIIPQQHEEAFADALLRLTENENLRNDMGSSGGLTAVSRFSRRRLVSDTSALYARLLQSC